MSGNGISWAICKCAHRSRQITTPAPHHSVFYRPDALPVAKPTASKQWQLFAIIDCFLPSSIRGLATPWTCFLYLSLSSIILIDSSTGVLSISLCCPSRPCVVFLTCVHLALFLALSLSPGNCLVSSWCDHSMLCYHHPWLNDILQLLNAVAKIHHAMKSCLW